MKLNADRFAVAVLNALSPEHLSMVHQMLAARKETRGLAYVSLPGALEDEGVKTLSVHLWGEDRLAVIIAMKGVTVHTADGHIAVVFDEPLPDTVRLALRGAPISRLFRNRLVEGTIIDCEPTGAQPGGMMARLHSEDSEIEL